MVTRFLRAGFCLLVLAGVVAVPVPAAAQESTPVGVSCGAGSVFLELQAEAQFGVDADVSFLWVMDGELRYTPNVSEAFPPGEEILGSDVMGEVSGTLLVSLREWPTSTLGVEELVSDYEALAAEHGVEGLEGSSREPGTAVTTAPDPIELDITGFFNLEEAYLAAIGGQPAPPGSGTFALTPGSDVLSGSEWQAAYGEYGVVVEGLNLPLPGGGTCEVVASEGGDQELAAWFGIVPSQQQLQAIQGGAIAQLETDEAAADERGLRVFFIVFGLALVVVVVWVGWWAVSRRRRTRR